MHRGASAAKAGINKLLFDLWLDYYKLFMSFMKSLVWSAVEEEDGWDFVVVISCFCPTFFESDTN